jgi:hypothetical protein
MWWWLENIPIVEKSGRTKKTSDKKMFIRMSKSAFEIEINFKSEGEQEPN